MNRREQGEDPVMAMEANRSFRHPMAS